MGAKCVSESKKLCQNDLQISTNISNQPIKMTEHSYHRDDLSSLMMMKKDHIHEKQYKAEEEEEDKFDEIDELFDQDELVEFDNVGFFPVMNITNMQDIKSSNLGRPIHPLVLKINENNSAAIESDYGMQRQGKLQFTETNTIKKRTYILQPLQVIKKPSFDNIIPHLTLIPKEQQVLSYNVSKQVNYYQNINKMIHSSEPPESQFKRNSTNNSFQAENTTKIRKLTVFINQHPFKDLQTIMNQISINQYQVSIKLTHDNYKEYLDRFLMRVNCRKLNIEINNISHRISPIYIQNLNNLKLNLSGYNCSTTNIMFQDSLFQFFCNNYASLQTLKIKARECSITHFFVLLQNEITVKYLTKLVKISLDLVFFETYQSNLSLLNGLENLIHNAEWIIKWNLLFRFKQQITCELAGEFEKNSHITLDESYLITQQRDSQLYKPIDQSSFLSPIMDKHLLLSNKRLKTQLFNNQVQIDNSATKVAPPNLNKKPSSLKKSVKLNQNKPLLMLMQELRFDYVDIDNSQDGSQNSQNQVPKSPDRNNTVSFANNSEVPYSIKKQIDQNQQYQIMTSTRPRKKSNFLDTSNSIGIDFINQKPQEEINEEQKYILQGVFINVLKQVATKQVKKFALIDLSGRLKVEDFFPIILQYFNLNYLSLTFLMSEDIHLYLLQNIIRNNQNTLKKLILSVEKKIITSVFDDQRLFNQIEKLHTLEHLQINYQTQDFLPKYIVKMKSLICFKDLYPYKIGLNKFNPFLKENYSKNSSNSPMKKQNTFNLLIELLKETNLLTFKSDQLQNNIPQSLYHVLVTHLLTQKALCYQYCILKNFKIKNLSIFHDILSFYM